MIPETIIARGAEAILIKEDGKLIKRRISKGYRIKEIDESLRKKRTKAEAKIIEKLKDKINVPKIIKVDEYSKEIIMEFIDGKKLSEYLDLLKNRNEIMEQVGKEVGKLHDLNIIHGDLTTSNMILVDNLNKIKVNNENKNKIIDSINKNFINNNKINKKSAKGNEDIINKNFKVYLIDFGLSFHSERIEDKAVDLHLIKQALEAKHFLHWKELFQSVLNGYKTKDKDKILMQLEKVEARGRYKH